MTKTKEIEQARALYYKFFGIIYSFINDKKCIDDINELIKLFLQNAINDEAKEALVKMQEFLSSDGYQKLKEENNNVFISPDSAFVPMSASYFDEGRDDGQKRVKASELVYSSRFRRNETKTNDPEDNIPFLFSFMHALIQDGVNGNKESLELSKKVFEEMFNDFLNDYIDILYTHENANFYKNSAILLKIFTDFERIYLNVTPSNRHMSDERVSSIIQKDRKPLTQKIRRNLDEIKL